MPRWCTEIKISIKHAYFFCVYFIIYNDIVHFPRHLFRDCMVINYGEGGGGWQGGGDLRNGKIAGPKLVVPSPQDRVKLFAPPPPFKGWKLFVPPPITMAKTSSFRVKTTSKLVVPPFSMPKTFSVPPFCRGKTSLAPPLPFCSPPPPLPVI